MSNAAILINTIGKYESTMTSSASNVEKLVIIGSGPAGHTAAIYSNLVVCANS